MSGGGEVAADDHVRGGVQQAGRGGGQMSLGLVRRPDGDDEGKGEGEGVGARGDGFGSGGGGVFVCFVFRLSL